MTGTQPQDVKHVCRKCGASFESRRPTASRTAKTSAHGRARRHIEWDHGFQVAEACHSNCSFKITFEEANEGRMLYGEGARS
jgi:hypothetical protein